MRSVTSVRALSPRYGERDSSCERACLNAVSSVNPSILKEIRDTVLDQIRSNENPQSVAQAKQVFQGVNTLINLAKTELDYRRYIDNNLAKLIVMEKNEVFKLLNIEDLKDLPGAVMDLIEGILMSGTKSIAS